jgi:hypothetical protein
MATRSAGDRVSTAQVSAQRGEWCARSRIGRSQVLNGNALELLVRLLARQSAHEVLVDAAGPTNAEAPEPVQ